MKKLHKALRRLPSGTGVKIDDDGYRLRLAVCYVKAEFVGDGRYSAALAWLKTQTPVLFPKVCNNPEPAGGPEIDVIGVDPAASGGDKGAVFVVMRGLNAGPDGVTMWRAPATDAPTPEPADKAWPELKPRPAPLSSFMKKRDEIMEGIMASAAEKAEPAAAQPVVDAPVEPAANIVEPVSVRQQVLSQCYGADVGFGRRLLAAAAKALRETGSASFAKAADELEGVNDKDVKA